MDLAGPDFNSLRFITINSATYTKQEVIDICTLESTGHQ